MVISLCFLSFFPIRTSTSPHLFLTLQLWVRGAVVGRGLCKLSVCIVWTGKGLYLAHFVPFARAVTADSPHVYFISRGGCLVSLPSDVINAQRAGPVVLSLMNSAVAALLPTSLPKLKVSN